MQTIARSSFTTVKTEGGLLPADLLQRIADGRDVKGLRPEDYHLLPGERLNEAINRAWNRCLGAWESFDEQRQMLSASDTGTTLTRERWLLILFQELGYGRLQTQRGGLTTEDGTSYPISHLWENVAPIHLVTFRQALDRRSELSTQVKRSPHSLMQEFLNRSPEYRWGIIANGLQLRLLRDNASLRRAAYVEFDLEAMMTGELYAEFSLLWLVCHQSRIEPHSERVGDSPHALPSALKRKGDDADEEQGEASEDDNAADARATCWLEEWSKQAIDQGTRALDALRDGVTEAIEALGRGFLQHRANHTLHQRLRSGDLSAQEYYQQLRRLVYRLIFLFVAEDRDLLLLPDVAPIVRRRYQDFYSLHRLRAIAAELRGSPHTDLYQQLRLLFGLLREGYPALGLPALGSYLFSDRSTPDLDALEIANRDLLTAIRALAFTVESSVLRAVDYRNLGTEELGSVYESLLELHPNLEIGSGTFALTSVAGSERKTTGSYYTPEALVNELLNSALEPVVQDRLRKAREGKRGSWELGVGSGEAPPHSPLPIPHSPFSHSPLEDALLSIKVLDFACGSGHMLIGAARRLALHLARIRSGDDEPGPDLIRNALRDVVRHCIYGVDLNATSVELCKVALWMETLEPGKPLGFLDANIRHGNSLLGVANLEDLAEGIPDDAFTPKSGDDKGTMAALKRRNKREREGQLPLPYHVTVIESAEDLARWRASEMAKIIGDGEDDAAAIAAKAAAFEGYLASEKVAKDRLKADLWTAAFFWTVAAGNADHMVAPTDGVLQAINRGDTPNPALVQGVQALAQRHNFFHWSVEFPQIYLHGGFDVILSNPPWERIKLQEKEWFAVRDPQIANAPNAAARRKLIAALARENPTLYADFERDKHGAESESHFVRASERYPLCGRGDVNTYAIFAELAYQMVHATGRAGVIVPTGIATDDTTKYYFQEITEQGALVSLYDFENRRAIFPGVHRSYKFALLTLTGEDRPVEAAEFVFFALDVADLRDAERRFTLTAAEIALLNPNTRTVPIFRSQRDAELTKAIYRRVPVLIKEGGGPSGAEENPWGISFLRMFDMSNDSHLFRTRAQLEGDGWRLEGNRFVRGDEVYLPLYEAKMFHYYDHRWATYDGAESRYLSLREKLDPNCVVLPRYWLTKQDVFGQVNQKDTRWLLGFRNVARSTDERTGIFGILPLSAVGHSCQLILCKKQGAAWPLVSNFASLVADYTVRQKIGGINFTYGYVRQIPVLPPSTYSRTAAWQQGKMGIGQFLLSRVLELTYTAWDLQPFAQDCGYDGPPFRWDEERRFLLRCELDAAYFHLYGIARDDVEYIMETFPIVKRKDMAGYGCYRTKETILSIYDEMAAAMNPTLALPSLGREPSRGGYQTRLDPPPADPAVAHPPRANP